MLQSRTSARGSCRVLDMVWLVLLCAVAGTRVWLCSAALPFFNNVDEPFHYDLVHKYARGYWPVRPPHGRERARESNTFDREAAQIIGLYATPEYLNAPARFPGGKFPPPPWSLQASDQQRYLELATARYTHANNREAFSPPIYYVVAGAWYDVGKMIGLHDGRLLYWIRFLNVPLIIAVIALAYVFCARFYPEQPLLRRGVPLLLAFVPQDIFYAVNADVLSPLLFLAGLILLLTWHRLPRVSVGFCLATGLLLAATVLVKYTNVAILAVFGVLAVRRLLQGCRDRSALLISAAAGAPLALWFLRNKLLVGDFLGTASKVEQLHWTRKPLVALLDHPLFTPAGMGHYLYELTAQLWRGEIAWWNMPRLAAPEIDPFLVGGSALLIGAAVIRWLISRKSRSIHASIPPGSDTAHFTDGVCLLAVSVAVLTLMALSLAFDFGDCCYPSKDEPYFYSARLIIGILVPFFALYVRGLQFLFARVARVAGPVMGLTATVVLMVLSKLGPMLMAGQSPYNWFHLP